VTPSRRSCSPANPDPRGSRRPGAVRTAMRPSSTSTWRWGRAHACCAPRGAFGFIQRYAWEPWHWGFPPGCRRRAGHLDVAAAAGLPNWVPVRYRRSILRRRPRTRAAAGAVGGVAAHLNRGSGPMRSAPMGTQGIAQFMPATAGLGPARPFDPDQAIPAARGAGRPPARLRSAALALAAYNVARCRAPPWRRAALRRDAGVRRARPWLAGGAALIGAGGEGDGVALMRIDGRSV